MGAKGKGKDKPVLDASLRDTENVPLGEDVDTYFKREVLPHAPDAWIDHEKTQVGYEIPFNRHFYVFHPPRPLGEIDAELKVVGDGQITKILVLENAADVSAIAGAFLKLAEQAGNVLDVFGAEFFAFAPEAFPHLLPETADVDQLYLALARGGLLRRISVARAPGVGWHRGIPRSVLYLNLLTSYPMTLPERLPEFESS